MLDRRADRGEATAVIQQDFARDDTVWRAALWDGMRRRKIPRPLALAYLREAARTALVFQHNDWETSAVSPKVGLRQGCSASPMLFRWVVQDALADLEARWISDGAGLDVGSQSPLTHLCWADDTWLFAALIRRAAYQVRTLRQGGEPPAGNPEMHESRERPARHEKKRRAQGSSTAHRS